MLNLLFVNVYISWIPDIILFYILDANQDNVVLAKSLHYLVPPPATTAVQNFTPTMEASQKSFYQFVKSYDELEQKINSRKELWKLNNIEPHPIIFGVKFDSSVRYVVIMNELQFPFHEFLHAFDAAFKMFHFFNIPYPPESVKFWSIVSVSLYNVNTDLHVTGKLCTVVNVLKSYMQKAKTPPRRSPRQSPQRSPRRSPRRSSEGYSHKLKNWAQPPNETDVEARKEWHFIECEILFDGKGTLLIFFVGVL